MNHKLYNMCFVYRLLFLTIQSNNKHKTGKDSVRTDIGPGRVLEIKKGLELAFVSFNF